MPNISILLWKKQRYYWRKVVAVGDNYIDLSINDCDPSVENDIPMSGDVIVTMGNSENTARQNVIVISSYKFALTMIKINNLIKAC